MWRWARFKNYCCAFEEKGRKQLKVIFVSNMYFGFHYDFFWRTTSNECFIVIRGTNYTLLPRLADTHCWRFLMNIFSSNTCASMDTKPINWFPRLAAAYHYQITHTFLQLTRILPKNYLFKRIDSFKPYKMRCCS